MYKTMQIEIKFSAYVTIEADTIEEAREKWYNLNLWSEEAQNCGAEFSETLEARDRDTYESVMDEC